MPSISYPTQLDVSGPWLIGEESLKQLDALVTQCFEDMTTEADRVAKERFDQKVAELVNEGTSAESAKRRTASLQGLSESGIRAHSRDHHTVTVYLTEGRSASAASFSELAVMPNMHSEAPVGFRVTLRVEEMSCEVSLDSSYSDELRAKVGPENSELSQSIFGRLQNWVVSATAPRWQRQWLKLHEFGIIIFPLLILFFLGSMTKLGLTPPKEYKEEAHTLLKQGVNVSNQAQAIELLLAIDSEYDGGTVGPKLHLGIHFWVYSGEVALLLVAFFICPKRAIGIWQGSKSVKRWRNWLTFVSVTVPTTIVSTIVIPWLVQMMGLSH